VPELIDDYNESTSGVDKCDQLLVYYAVNRKTPKWWKCLFFRLLDMAVINAIILYGYAFTKDIEKRQSHKKFRLQLAHQVKIKIQRYTTHE